MHLNAYFQITMALFVYLKSSIIYGENFALGLDKLNNEHTHPIVNEIHERPVITKVIH